MDKSNLPYNRLKQSFEEGFDDAVAPVDGWDAVLKGLENSGTAEESAEKVKQSFEEIAENETSVPPLWSAIATELDKASHATTNNKIKASFEEQYQENAPDNLWDNVENQLEIESVWDEVKTVLDRRSRWVYWREKGMQLGIVALLVLWLRGCGVGEYFPIYDNPNYIEQVGDTKGQKETILTNAVADDPLSRPHSTKKEITTTKAERTNVIQQKEKQASSKPSTTTVVTKTLNQRPTKQPAKQVVVKAKEENSIAPEMAFTVPELSRPTSVVNELPLVDNGTKGSRETLEEEQESIVIAKEQNQTSRVTETKTIAATAARVNSIAMSSNVSTNTETTTANQISVVRQNYSANNIASLSPSILNNQTVLETIEGIPTLENKRHLKLSFELGLLGRVGTSLMLCQQMERAMDETSMVKTKIRPAGAVGVQLQGHLTKNDAIVVTAFPFSSSQQYFAGYTEQGRYYQKEIKLTYLDFLIGYQRVLLHYNKVGLVPSTLYARVDYGLSYLNQSEEEVNGEFIETTEQYNRLTQNLGLSLGSSHRIGHFKIDYGLSFQAGITSLSNQAYAADPTNLMTLSGYIGVHYRL